MNHTSTMDSVDEWERSGLEPAESVVVAPQRVAASPVSFECTVTQVVRLTDTEGGELDTWMTFGEVVGVHIDESLLVDGVYDTALARPVMRGGGPSAYYEVGERFDLGRPQLAESDGLAQGLALLGPRETEVREARRWWTIAPRGTCGRSGVRYELPDGRVLLDDVVVPGRRGRQGRAGRGQRRRQDDAAADRHRRPRAARRRGDAHRRARRDAPGRQGRPRWRRRRADRRRPAAQRQPAPHPRRPPRPSTPASSR